jgi:hypothetical protein
MSVERSGFLSPFTRLLVLIVTLYATWGAESCLFHLYIRRPWPADILWRHIMLGDAARLLKSASPLSPKNVAICLRHRRLVAAVGSRHRIACLVHTDACGRLFGDFVVIYYQLLYLGDEINENVIGILCGTFDGRQEMRVGFWWRGLNGKDLLGYVIAGGR